MPEWSEEAAVEIEALQATYEDEITIDQPLQQVSMLVLPATAGQQQQHFVECQLVCTLCSDYPSSTPAIELRDVRGFVNRQEQLKQQLLAEACELSGELLLGHLFESAKAWLSEQDQPEGPCIFCLEDLAGAAAASNAAMHLPCFHAYHESCFAGWWCWQQQAYMDQQRALEEKTGATAAAALVQESLPPKDGQHFRLSCPTCRSPFQQADLPSPMQQELQQQLQSQQQAAGQQQQQQQQQQQHPDAAKLTAAQLQPFLQLQQQFAKMFVQQQQRQGIIDTDASYCIADWERPSSSSTAAAAGDAAASGGSLASSSNSSAAAAAAAAAVSGVRGGRRGASACAAGPQQRGGGGGGGMGRGWGRSRGRRHFSSSDGSDTFDGSQQQQQQSHHHHHNQQQQAQQLRHQSWRQQEQEWTPKPGHSRGRGRQQQQQQQQQQPGGVQLSTVHADASPLPRTQQQGQQQRSDRLHHVVQQEGSWQAPRGGDRGRGRGTDRGRGRGAARGRVAGRGDELNGSW